LPRDLYFSAEISCKLISLFVGTRFPFCDKSPTKTTPRFERPFSRYLESVATLVRLARSYFFFAGQRSFHLLPSFPKDTGIFSLVFLPPPAPPLPSLFSPDQPQGPTPKKSSLDTLPLRPLFCASCDSLAWFPPRAAGLSETFPTIPLTPAPLFSNPLSPPPWAVTRKAGEQWLFPPPT